MRTWYCSCSNPLFFDNSFCLSCQAEVGWCPSCHNMVNLVSQGVDDQYSYQCGNSACGVYLNKCHNHAVELVCNRMILNVPDSEDSALCDCCRYNNVIPDLGEEGNRHKWAQLERAKRRLFFTLNSIGLPHGTRAQNFRVPLGFSFMADKRPDTGLWRSFFKGSVEKVYTGHDEGHITINIVEADEVAREKFRVDMNESHRTLIGHFRHEIGHYYWELLVKDIEEPKCIAYFGDHNMPTYSDALESYYEKGAPADWKESYISAYATMHPWEDFAETFAFYLDIVAVLDTTNHLDMKRAVHDGSLESMLQAFRRVGITINEINREMGLLDLVPEALTPAITHKLSYIHDLVHRASNTHIAAVPDSCIA